MFSVATVESATGRMALERPLFQSKEEFWSSAIPIMGAYKPRPRGSHGWRHGWDRMEMVQGWLSGELFQF